MAEAQTKRVDVEQIIRSKTGNRKVPRFFINYMKKILHEDELNQYLVEHPDDQGLDFLDSGLDYIDVKLQVEGEENLPADGLYTFVSNHPLGGPDGMAIGKIIGHHYDGNFCYLVNSFLMFFPPLAPLCVPINKMGGQARNLPQLVDSVFSSDKQVIMVPAGLCSRKQKGVIRDLEWKKTFVQKSVQYQRDVVPIYFDGRNSNRFYRIANICKRLGIKFNIAMMFLVDEMFLHRHDTFRVVIGKPIPWQSFDKSRTPAQWAQQVKDTVYALKPND